MSQSGYTVVGRSNKNIEDEANEFRRMNTRAAVVAWMLGGDQTLVHRNVRKIISKMIYATRKERVWEN